MTDETTLPSVIVIASPKGGSGKTITTILLACEFAATGHTVKIIDADPQGSVSRWFKTSRELGFTLNGISVEPVITDNPMFQQTKIAEVIAASRGTDVVLIDVQGTAQGAMGAGLQKADLVLIPARPHLFDINQAAELCRYLSASSGTVPYRIMINALSELSRKSPAFATALETIKREKLPCLNTTLSERPTFANVATAGNLYEAKPLTKPIENARANTRRLLTEIISLLNEEAAAA
ncbi:MAG: chromosome partitioning [Beijerinckiaceae bacterium]|nr:MAG: chromosome partitioning [Beijerinckiaceae bacterium]